MAGPGGDLDLNVAIRTVAVTPDGSAVLGVGGGITIDSDPYREWQNAWTRHRRSEPRRHRIVIGTVKMSVMGLITSGADPREVRNRLAAARDAVVGGALPRPTVSATNLSRRGYCQFGGSRRRPPITSIRRWSAGRPVQERLANHLSPAPSNACDSCSPTRSPTRT